MSASFKMLAPCWTCLHDATRLNAKIPRSTRIYGAANDERSSCGETFMRATSRLHVSATEWVAELGRTHRIETCTAPDGRFMSRRFVAGAEDRPAARCLCVYTKAGEELPATIVDIGVYDKADGLLEPPCSAMELCSLLPRGLARRQDPLAQFVFRPTKTWRSCAASESVGAIRFRPTKT
jgi:hypothetical protein